MPVLKVKQNDVWKEISGISEHTHDVDNFLSNTSTNPVQNKVVNEALGYFC